MVQMGTFAWLKICPKCFFVQGSAVWTSLEKLTALHGFPSALYLAATLRRREEGEDKRKGRKEKGGYGRGAEERREGLAPRGWALSAP